jgi:hypothetical protein
MELQRGDGLDNFDMCLVQCADEDSVYPNSPWDTKTILAVGSDALLASLRLPLHPFSPVCELLSLAWRSVRSPYIVPSKFAPLEIVWLGHGMDDARGGCFHGAGVGISSRAGADDDEARRSLGGSC